MSLNTQTSLTGLRANLQLVAAPPAWPAIIDVVFLMFREGGATPSSAWVRGTELARVETRRRSGWSSLRLRRRWLRLGSLKLRPLIRLIRLWETTSSKRSRCFLGMKILANIVGSDIDLRHGGEKKTLRPLQEKYHNDKKKNAPKQCFNPRLNPSPPSPTPEKQETFR